MVVSLPGVGVSIPTVFLDIFDTWHAYLCDEFRSVHLLAFHLFGSLAQHVDYNLAFMRSGSLILISYFRGSLCEDHVHYGWCRRDVLWNLHS